MLEGIAMAASGWRLAAAMGVLVATFAPAALAAERPNILWISIEDTSPWLGFCGQPYATTPNLDRLAREGVHYTNAFATAPVCSPCRYAIITGTYATSYGTQRLRSQFAIPDTLHGFPSHLRQAGYFCTNNVKTDYNTIAEKRLVAESWDECSAKAHWRHRPAGRPFFAVFNLMETHQSRVFEQTPEPKLDPSQRHDPARAPLPPYYPDTPTARRTMARVHDCITAVDLHAGRILAELEQDGLKDDTIIFFWPDHGQGIPRGKRTLWDTGLKVPLVVRFPEKYRHLAPAAPGSTCDRLLYLMDLGPTLLSIAGLPMPGAMQGQAFLGSAAGAPRACVFGARDRVDEVAELSRSVRGQRYLYVRNFMPDLSWNQPETYSDQLELRREITRLAGEGQLNAAQLTYAGPTKPDEALYDTQSDPWQMRNLAADPAHAAVLTRMRKTLHNWQLETRDLGLIHESEAARMCAGGQVLHEVARSDASYALGRVLDTAERVGEAGQVDTFAGRLVDTDPTVRYWAALGLRVAGRAALAAKPALVKACQDKSAAVRIEAAGVLVTQDADPRAINVLVAAIRGDDEHARLHAARTLQMLGEKSRPALPALRLALEGANELSFRWSLLGAVERLTGQPASPFKKPKAARHAR
jgi:arylsulfatase A-like enzyme